MKSSLPPLEGEANRATSASPDAVAAPRPAPPRGADDEQAAIQRAVETAIRISAVALVGYLCFKAFQPFLLATLWGTMIAVALRPTHLRLTSWLRGRSTLAAITLTGALFSLFIVPAVIVTESVASGARSLISAYGAGTLRIPPPPPSLQSLPVVGERIHALWLLASQDLRAAFEQSATSLEDVGPWLLSLARSTGAGLIQFTLATVITAILLATAPRTTAVLRLFAAKLAPKQGPVYLLLAEQTVRSVAVGVLGVALLQTTLAGAGYVAAGLPGAGLLTLLTLILAVVQIGVGPPMIGAAVYLFSQGQTTTAVGFTVWLVVVIPLDNVLRPLLLGRGTQVPMLVVLLGALGGLLNAGVIGMFLGSVICAVGFQLFRTWLGVAPVTMPEGSTAPEEPGRTSP